MNEAGGDIAERHQDEETLVQPGMWNGDSFVVDDQVVVEQQVEIDRTRGVGKWPLSIQSRFDLMQTCE
ncbi:MAG: hypothetical protein R3A46_14255 [Thermomicrobiales bacterium]